MEVAGFLDRHADKAYAPLRMVAGLMFSVHGMQKLFGWLTENPQPDIGSQHWVGGLIELTCGLLIFVGLFTRLAAFLASGTMAVAYLQFHWKVFEPPFAWNFDGAFDAFHWVPVVKSNGGELALLYCFLFLFICFAGGRRCSLDRLRHRGRAPIAPAPSTTSSYR